MSKLSNNIKTIRENVNYIPQLGGGILRIPFNGKTFLAQFYETLINEKIQFDVYNFSKTDGTNKFLRYIENNHVSSLEFKPNLNILHSCQIYHPSSTRRYN